ncbi:PREDICTED: UDP-glycosyltransferase 72E3-like [Camelina sativa]|uniref:UDP-glycosyltransferase 72E3-like n=1 Tax=Camelina sativa TaxID=90675 RepID=A0ABM0Y747_CAMSA|nr:PREDICTED: UDP-glycosyltransferase 72E3-like [Camelina sativa]
MHIRKPHAAMFASPGMGHVMPVMELAKRLSANHGFKVTVFVLETDAASVQSKFLNSTGVDLVNLPSPDISGLVNPEDRLVTKIGVIMREAVPALRSKIAAMHQKPTALIVDLFGTDALCLAAELNMLAYVFFASNARFLGVSMYYSTLDKDIKEDHAVQRSPLAVPGCEPVRFEDTMDSYLVLDEPVSRDLVRHYLAYPKADGILVNTWEEMEPKSLKSLQDPKLLGRVARVPVYPVGPLCIPIKSSKNEHPVFDWLNEQPDESVLYISFGSGGSLTASQLTELAWGLDHSQLLRMKRSFY